jgi:hypothetical protein
MKKQIVFGLAATLSAQASIVSWNYDRFGTVSGADTAGVSPAANWNNSWPANPVTDLIDKDGQATTLDIAYTSFNTWSIQGSAPALDTDGKSNKRLLNGYLNAGPAGWNPPVTASTVTLSQIPYPAYDLIVYFSSDGADREGTVSDGTTTYHFKTLGAPSLAGGNATLAQATDTTTAGYATAANYAVFSGLSGATKTLTVQMRDNDEWGGIAGFQVVADLGSVPEFGLQPEDQQAAVGSDATITAAAVADPAPEFQWEYSADGETGWTPLGGQTAATLVLAGVVLTDEGYYRVVATNINGSVPSEDAFLDVFYAAPEIITQPADAYAEEGSTVQLSVLAFGYETLSYQWYKDSTLIPGETSETLVLSNVDSSAEGSYHVEISDSVEPGLTSTSDTANVFTFPEWNGLVSHDSFDPGAGYATGELALQNPPVSGYAGAWTDVNFGDAEPEVMAGSLAYSDPLYLGSAGDQVGKAADIDGIGGANSGRVYRALAPALVVAENTTGTRYLSWLYRNGNQNTAANPYTHSTLALYHNTGGAAPAGDAALRVFSAGISDADYGNTNYGFRCNDTLTGNLAKPVDANVHLFVVKLTLGDTPGSDSITVWIDPVLGSGEPAGGSTLDGLNLHFESIALSDYASNSSAWDELRWGSSFDSVTLNPNPPDDFATWIAAYPGVGALDGIEDDADRDGIPNGIENYFGTDPSQPSRGLTQIATTGNTVTFQHPRNPAPASDLSAALRWSTDLSAWHGHGETSGGVTVSFSSAPDTLVAGTTTVTANISGTLPAKLFTEISVTPAP